MVKDQPPEAENQTVTGFARRRSAQPSAPEAARDDDVSPTSPTSPSSPGPQDGVRYGLAVTVLAVLAGWTGLHAVFAPLLLSGQQLSMTIAVDVLATASLTTAVLLARRPDPWSLTLPLALAPALAAARAVASGEPLIGLDAGICLLVAALLLPRLHLLLVSTTALAAWVGVGAYGIVVHLVSGSTAGEPSGRVAGAWAYSVAMVAGAALVARAVQTLVTYHPPAEASTERSEGLARDPLTGLANRAGIELAAAPMIEHARRSGQAVHCLYIDVDGLRAVNEAVGLAGGDAVLRDVAAVVHHCVRGTDVVCRWNGDEFVVLGPGTGMSPLELERRVRARLITDPPVPVEVWNGRVSIGSATLVPWDDGDLGALVTRGEVDMQMRRSLRRQSRDRLAGPLGPRASGTPSGENTEGTRLS